MNGAVDSGMSVHGQRQNGGECYLRPVGGERVRDLNDEPVALVGLNSRSRILP